jgi:hypothetical protein
MHSSLTQAVVFVPEQRRVGAESWSVTDLQSFPCKATQRIRRWASAKVNYPMK